MVRVIDMIQNLEVEFSIDPERLYIVGQSMGGIGTWHFIARNLSLANSNLAGNS